MKVILTADFHLMEKTPVCRTDNYLETLQEKLIFIAKYQYNNNIQYILHAGDLFDTWKSSHALVTWAYGNLPTGIITIYGQHEAPGHNLSLYEKTNLHLLSEIGKIKALNCRNQFVLSEREENITIHAFPYGTFSVESIKDLKLTKNKFIVMLHGMFQQPGKENPYIESIMPVHDLLDALPSNCMGVLAGDNHQTFTVKKGKKWFLSPGSIMRISADQWNHVPTFFVWDTNNNSIEPVPIPHDKKAVSKEHLKIEKERDARIEAFVYRIKTDYQVELSYVKNLERFYKRNNTRKSIREMIGNALDGVSTSL